MDAFYEANQEGTNLRETSRMVVRLFPSSRVVDSLGIGTGNDTFLKVNNNLNHRPLLF